MQVIDSQAEKIYGDIFEFLDLKGDYGNAESLSVLGIQHLHGTKRNKRDFERARQSFERALLIDSKDVEANYHMGLIYMMGLGV
jgi:TPR repeat protein